MHTLEEAQDALTKAKIQLMARPDSAFFTTLCFSMQTIFDESIPTACTNSVWIKFNTAFFMGLSVEEQIFLLLHESMHPALMHTVRMPEGACPDRWNIAGDHVINLILIERGFKMPKGGCADPKFKGLTTEEVYALLPEDCGKPSMQDLVHSTGNEQVERDIQDILVRAAIQSKISNDKAGTIPGEIEIFLNRLLNPKLPWNQILQKYLRSLDKSDYSWRKPNRRFFPKYYLPSMYNESVIDMAVATDTSGSVTDANFLRIVTETSSILRMMKPKKLTLVQFDTKIKSVSPVSSLKELMNVTFTGRGGTKIDPVLEWANENKPQLLLVFTDGYFEFSELKTKSNVIWLIHDNPDFEAPFGKVIHYSMEN